MHQIQFRYSAPPHPLDGHKGPTSGVKDGKGSRIGGWEGRVVGRDEKGKKEGVGRKGRKGKGGNSQRVGLHFPMLEILKKCPGKESNTNAQCLIARYIK